MSRILLFFLIAAPFFCRAVEPLPGDATGYEWMDKIVDEEFVRYSETGITKEMLETTWNVCRHEGMQRFKVIDSQVFGPSGPVKNLLEKLVKAYPVPDVDFIYFPHDILQDWYFFNRGLRNNSPIFAGAKNRFFDRVVLFIDRHFDIGNEQGWEGTIRQIDEANQSKWPWEGKKEKLFWRGLGSDGCYCIHNWSKVPRGRIVQFSRHKHPDLIDAAFTDVDSRDRGRVAHIVRFEGDVPLHTYLQFKYQLLVDGTTCTFPDAQWRLLSGCLTLKQESDDIMWFSKEMIPWKHYVPLEHYLSDAPEKILWAKDHDEEARQIAENAREFAMTHIMPEHIMLYCYKVLVRYAELQRFDPEN